MEISENYNGDSEIVSPGGSLIGTCLFRNQTFA